MRLSTRLTEAFELQAPIILAPMGVAASGPLAAAVSRGGGLGLIGVGYRGEDWIETQLDAAGDNSVGVGFITWLLQDQPALLGLALRRAPRAICLSFGDPRPFAEQIHKAGVALICQAQSKADAIEALEAGAKVIVAQGTEAGGHAGARSMSTLTPEIADLIAARSPDTLLCAAGGIADGRGLAAALQLGADGVLMGSRLWASTEANVHPKFHQTALAADGDSTVRTTLMDILRSYPWPDRYTNRALNNRFLKAWQGREKELAAVAATELEKWNAAWEKGDAENSNLFISESVGLINMIAPAAEIIAGIVAQAIRQLEATGKLIVATEAAELPLSV